MAIIHVVGFAILCSLNVNFAKVLRDDDTLVPYARPQVNFDTMDGPVPLTEFGAFSTMVKHGKEVKDFFDRIVVKETYQSQACGECGVVGTAGKRIVNGTTVSPQNKYPWMVWLRIGDMGYCGAYLIAPNIVATAAHCASLFGPLARNDLTLYFGCFNIANTGAQCEARRGPFLPGDVTVHPQYWGQLTRIKHDVARIQLRRPVRCSQRIRPICLPTDDMEVENLDAVVAGWGAMNENGRNGAQDLQETTLRIGTKETCMARDNTVNFVEKICTFSSESTDCSGDSGGPLFVDVDGKKYVVGSVSYGPMPCKEVSMYAYVKTYRKFLLTGDWEM